METVDRLKSEKEDLEQEIGDLTTRNDLLRANNEVQGSSFVAGGDDVDGGNGDNEYYSMYEELKFSYESLSEQKEKLGRDFMAAREEMVRAKLTFIMRQYCIMP